MYTYRRHIYEVYILTNKHKTVFYTGVSNNLPHRLIEHWIGDANKKSFTSRYNCYYLLYYEVFGYIDQAIIREKEIKGWTREKKLMLIKSKNPNLDFLNEEVCRVWPPDGMGRRVGSY